MKHHKKGREEHGHPPFALEARRNILQSRLLFDLLPWASFWWKQEESCFYLIRIRIPIASRNRKTFITSISSAPYPNFPRCLASFPVKPLSHLLLEVRSNFYQQLRLPRVLDVRFLLSRCICVAWKQLVWIFVDLIIVLFALISYPEFVDSLDLLFTRTHTLICSGIAAKGKHGNEQEIAWVRGREGGDLEFGHGRISTVN